MSKTTPVDGSDDQEAVVDERFDEALQDLANEIRTTADAVETIRADYQAGNLTDDEATRKVAEQLDIGIDPNEILRNGGEH